jgi:hypothetical protein
MTQKPADGRAFFNLELNPMHAFFSQYQSHLRKNYSTLPEALVQSLSPQLASPFIFKLKRKHYEDAQNIVRDLDKILQQTPEPKNPSILNSLDVHIDSDDQLKIIEINTNASSFLVNAEQYEVKQLPDFKDAKAKFKASFQQAFGANLQPGNLFLIVDENPEQQNMYFEFLMFREFLKKEFSIECEISAPQELTIDAEHQVMWRNKKVHGIYNRHTDFYFHNIPVLADAFRHDKTLISPNPWTYQAIADKNRLVEWSQKDLPFPYLQKALLKTFRFADFKDAEDLWAKRAQFFFKPPNAYGSRSVYRGKSISRTVFNRIYEPDYLAQQIVPAPEVSFDYENQHHNFKYDLRFYFFADQIHLAVARLYQGQLTNLQTPLGGLTPLEIV